MKTRTRVAYYSITDTWQIPEEIPTDWIGSLSLYTDWKTHKWINVFKNYQLLLKN